MSDCFSFSPIARVVSPYRQKFAIPRQPGLVTQAKGKLLLLPPWNGEECLRGLTQMSHIWVVFVFHQHIGAEAKALVRPPRLGGNRKVGVFSTRSTFRPNPIGLSVLCLDGMGCEDGQWYLSVSGLDLLHDTPILDIKPYIPYADSIPDAEAGFAREAPSLSVQSVSFEEHATHQISEAQRQLASSGEDIDFRELVVSVLQQDPRPAYKRGQDEGALYGMTLYDWEIRWRSTATGFVVFSVLPTSD
jgi:tRNA-Thr(GGU) m(6)t(6)A37 methyltransferase TsaA